MNANTIHGYPVLARRAVADSPDLHVVLVFRGGEHQPFITGWVQANDEAPTEWNLGHYLDTLEDAVEDLHQRASGQARKHVHVSKHSRDCDGPLDQDYVAQYEGDDGDFFTALGFAIRPGGTEFPATVVLDLEDSGWAAEVTQAHEEGGSLTELVECDDPNCDLDRRSQRDHYAEAMGY